MELSAVSTIYFLLSMQFNNRFYVGGLQLLEITFLKMAQPCDFSD